MKHITLLIALLAIVSVVVAEEITAENFAKLQAEHQKAIQNFGNLTLRDGKFSFAMVGRDLVSVASMGSEMSFYTETNGKKVYSHLEMLTGDRASEVVFSFDNKVTIGENSYTIKYKMVYSFGDKVGFTVTTEGTRWNLEKCWSCIKCAGDNIWKLYNAYKECGTDWQCWIMKYQTLIDLYQCVKDNCIACFQ